MQELGLLQLGPAGWVFLLACAVLATVPWYFIYQRVYDDGLLGRIFLGSIAGTAAIMILATCTTEWYYDVGLEVAFLASAFAGFLCWHLYRFHRRSLRSRGTAPCGKKDVMGCPYLDRLPAPPPRVLPLPAHDALPQPLAAMVRFDRREP